MVTFPIKTQKIAFIVDIEISILFNVAFYDKKIIFGIFLAIFGGEIFL